MARNPRTMLLATGICAGLFLVLLLLAYASPRARTLDATALDGFVAIPGDRSTTLAERIIALGNPGPVAFTGAVLALVALVRGRPRVALAVVFLVGVTSVSSQLLKALLAYPRATEEFVLDPELFPSGHATAAMTLALCTVLVVPGRLRPVAAAIGTIFALAMGFALISLGSHFPSDVVGGYLLASGWTFATVAALVAVERRRPERPGRVALRVRWGVDRIAAVGLVAALAATAIAVVIGSAVFVAARSPDLAGFARDHTAVLAVGVALVSAAVMLVAAVTATLRRDG